MSKRQEMREKRRRAETTNRLIIIGVVILLAALVAFFFIYPTLKPIGDIKDVTFHDRSSVDFNHMGDASAPIKVVEYADFQCPYCGRFWSTTEQQVIDNYIKTGKIYFTFRSMGDFLDKNGILTLSILITKN